MAEVVFDHVTRIYPGNDKPSVDDLNLDIKDGELTLWAFLGVLCGSAHDTPVSRTCEPARPA